MDYVDGAISLGTMSFVEMAINADKDVTNSLDILLKGIMLIKVLVILSMIIIRNK